jgi:hypothetical protein
MGEQVFRERRKFCAQKVMLFAKQLVVSDSYGQNAVLNFASP